MNTVSDNIIPQYIAETVLSPRSYADDAVIQPALRWLRQNLPMGKVDADDFTPFWIVSRHADVMAVERDPKLFPVGSSNLILNNRASEAFFNELDRDNPGLARPGMGFKDGAEHVKYRTLTSNFFMPRSVAKLESDIRAIARESVQKLIRLNGECDFVEDFALHYPLRVIMTLLGVPQKDEAFMLKLTQELFGVSDPDAQRSDVAVGPAAAAEHWRATVLDFHGYFTELTHQRRAHPTDDLLSLIANSHVDGELISEIEANGYYIAIATAGHDTTSSSVAGGMLGMLLTPGQLELVQADLSLVPKLVDEAIRWTCPVKHFMRMAARDTELGGAHIKQGDRLFVSFASATRDEEIFEDPDRFDVTRTSSRHMGFGFGPKMCIGQHLAKLEMRILFEELLPRLKSIELAGKPSFVESNFVAGPKRLPVRFEAV